MLFHGDELPGCMLGAWLQILACFRVLAYLGLHHHSVLRRVILRGLRVVGLLSFERDDLGCEVMNFLLLSHQTVRRTLRFRMNSLGRRGRPDDVHVD